MENVTINRSNLHSVLRRQNRKLKKSLAIAMGFCSVCLLSTILMAFTAIRIHQSNIQLSEQNSSLQLDLDMKSAELDLMKDSFVTVSNDNDKLTEENETLKEKTKDLLQISDELSEQNVALMDQVSVYMDAVEEYEQRSELYDKYSYAIVRDNGTRTDITYDNLKTVEQLEEEKGVDADLLLAMVMTESNGKEKAQSAISTAKGYGQFLNGTGKFVYEELLDNSDTYTGNKALDGDTNLQMLAAYLEYLDNYYNGDLYTVLRNYRGEGGKTLQNYIAKIDSYLEEKNKSVAVLARH